MTKPFRPMKAVDVVDVEALNYPVVALTKYDGVYATVKDGKLLGRSLKPFKSEFITELLSDYHLEGFVGELCFGSDLSADDLCRNTTSKVNTIKGEWDYTFVIFDYVHPDVIDLGYIERIEALRDEIYSKELYKIFNLRMANMVTIQKGWDLKGFYYDQLDSGYEGTIVRDPTGKWKNGRSTLREQGFMRMKPQSDKEAVIIGAEEAMENLNEAKVNELGYTERSSHQENKVGKGMVGAWLAVDVESGMEIKVGAGKLTHEEREKYFLDIPIGSVVKYRSMDRGVKEAPRFARHIGFRVEEDLDPKIMKKVVEIRSKLWDTIFMKLK